MSNYRVTAAGRLAFVFLWLFVCSFPVEKSFDIPGLGNVSKVLGALALGAGLLAVLIDGRIRMLSWAHAALAMFVFWSLLTVRWSLDPDATVQKALTAVQLFGLVWLVWEFCCDETHVVHLMQAYLAGTFVAAANTFGRYQLAHQTYYQRYAADGFDPNDFALTLALTIPLSYGLSLRANRRTVWIYWVQMALVCLSVLLSASRTGFLASCVALCIVPLTFAYTRRRRKLVIVVAALAAVLCVAAVVPATSWQRLGTIGSEVRSGSLNDRGAIWSAGLQVFRSQWFSGVGSGAYPRSVEPILGWPAGWLIVAHNTFLSILVETGVVGSLFFLGFLTLLVRAVWKQQGLWRIVWAVTLLTWLIGVNTLTWETRKPTWLLFALVLTQSRFVSVNSFRRFVPAARFGAAEARA